MAVKVLELHHHGIRVGPSAPRIRPLTRSWGPTIPSIDGYWMDVGGTAQIHLMGVDGQSKFAEGPGKDPSHPHVALAVEDIQEAKTELERMGVSFWVTRGVVGPESQQIFMHDPFGNMIELHQAGSCRCIGAKRPAVAAKSSMS